MWGFIFFLLIGDLIRIEENFSFVPERELAKSLNLSGSVAVEQQILYNSILKLRYHKYYISSFRYNCWIMFEIQTFLKVYFHLKENFFSLYSSQ